MSDAELEQELKRRRRKRANPRDRNLPHPETVMKWYGSLELEPGASLEVIEIAYDRLSKKYHPDKHKDDPVKHRVATELSDSLRHAYNQLVSHIRRRRKA